MPEIQKTKPIVLVEDNPLDLELTLRAFKVCGLTNPVEVARDGQEVLNVIARLIVENNAPSLVLLDLNMPKKTGLEVLAELKRNPQYQHIPVIMLTSSNAQSDITRAYELGINAYVVKPVDYDRFMDLLRAINTFWNTYNITPWDY